MAEISPFRGILYNQEAIGDLADVVAPPYDVISGEGAEKYFARHERNSIRLILGKGSQSSGERSSMYRQAAQVFNSWIDEGVLRQDPHPAIYVYSQRYALPDGSSRERFGFIARLKLEDFDKGIIMPHEFTFNRPREDRLNLMRACRANFDQIFCVYPDTQKKVDGALEEVANNEKETCCLVDEEGIVNRLWTVVDPATVGFILEQMADKKVLLADGHHRYEAALAYRDEMRRAGEGGEAAEYMMAYMVNMYAPGLSILPYHRMVKGLEGLNVLKLLQTLSDRFLLREVKSLTGETPRQTLKRLLERELENEGREGKAFGMYGKECGFWILRSMEDQSDQEDLPIADHLLSELDVTILHQQVIIPLLGIDSRETGEAGGIRYTSDPYEALAVVESSESDAAFFLNPANIDEIMAIAGAGGRMPQKSTYFYPKPITGMVINKLDA
jgi:uncharacterized protein (DUF1015 family)